MNQNNTLRLLEQIRKYAASGENFTQNQYDKARFNEIKEIAEQLYYILPGVEKINLDPLDNVGAVTPKVSVNAILKNEEGKILLEKRADDNCWGIPGGWAEVGFTAEENLKREIFEETNLEIEVLELIKVFSRIPDNRNFITSYHLLFNCKIIGGALKKSFESVDLRWLKIEEVENWHADHKSWLDKINYLFKD